MLQPSNHWQWQLDGDKRLLLDIDPQMAFTTAYNKKQLTMEVLSDTAFSLEDAIYYEDISEKLKSSGHWSVPEAVQIALNATAVKRYYKPMMPKSWFFKTNQSACQFGECVDELTVLLYSEVEVGRFLVIERSDNASVCMLLDESLALSEDKTMAQFDIIKVMNDRLFSIAEMRALKYA